MAGHGSRCVDSRYFLLPHGQKAFIKIFHSIPLFRVRIAVSGDPVCAKRQVCFDGAAVDRRLIALYISPGVQTGSGSGHVGGGNTGASHTGVGEIAWNGRNSRTVDVYSRGGQIRLDPSITGVTTAGVDVETAIGVIAGRSGDRKCSISGIGDGGGRVRI